METTRGVRLNRFIRVLVADAAMTELQVVIVPR